VNFLVIFVSPSSKDQDVNGKQNKEHRQPQVHGVSVQMDSLPLHAIKLIINDQSAGRAFRILQ
jgi:hypothetical protein